MASFSSLARLIVLIPPVSQLPAIGPVRLENTSVKFIPQSDELQDIAPVPDEIQERLAWHVDILPELAQYI